MAPPATIAPAPAPAELVVASLQATAGNRIAAVVANVGELPSSTGALVLRTADGHTLRVRVPAIAGGAERTVATRYACGPSTTTVTATLGGAMLRADLAFDCPTTGATGPTTSSPALADLVVAAIAGDGPALLVTVANVGDAPAPASSVAVTAGAGTPVLTPVASLAPGAATTVIVAWPCGAAAVDLTARVDAGGIVTQSATDDDTLTETLTVPCATLP